MKKVLVLLWCLLLGAALVSCGPSPAERDLIATQVAAEIYATQTAVAPTPELSSTVTPRSTPTPTHTPTPTLTPTSPFERTPADVVEVVDGDTIKVRIAGNVCRVRYIGIDTPETVHPERPVEWMGREASEANRQLVEGQTVYLEKDVSETDRYGRLLRYVFLADGLFVNAELVRLGYAQVSTYPPDVRYQDLFLEMQREAREGERGLWGPTPTPTPTRPPRPTPAPIPTASPSAQPPVAQAQVIVNRRCCQFNSPGNDNYNKEEEWVCFSNVGDGGADMTRWTLRDEFGWTFVFPEFALQVGGTVRVVTGCGGNTADMLFWCKDGTAVWNNDGDTVFLYDSGGNLVATYGC